MVVTPGDPWGFFLQKVKAGNSLSEMWIDHGYFESWSLHSCCCFCCRFAADVGSSGELCSWRSKSADLIWNFSQHLSPICEWEFEVMQPHSNMKTNSDVLMKMFLLLLLVTKLLSCFSPAFCAWCYCWDYYIALQLCTWADMQREKSSRALKSNEWTFIIN